MLELDVGYAICRVMRFYSMPYREVMDLPVRAFWFMSSQIDRVLASESLTSLHITASAQGGSSYEETKRQLLDVLGTPVRLDVGRVALQEERDEFGFQFLKKL